MKLKQNKLTRDGLDAAYLAIDKLDAEGIEIIAYYSNGRRAVLIINRKPEFVTGVVKRKVPTGSGLECVYASNYHGTQIEWTVVQPMVQAVGHA